MIVRPKAGPCPRNIADRFWPKVDRSGGPDACWPWTACRNRRSGYGRFGVGSRTDGTERVVDAHRVAWELTNGPVPNGLCVCHKCDNPVCCNPSHYFLGTLADNNRDCVAKGRHTYGSGHPRAKLTEQQVREIRASSPGLSQRRLARQYGISKGTVSAILQGRTWRTS